MGFVNICGCCMALELQKVYRSRVTTRRNGMETLQ
jgi:hypothetical protein